MSAEEVVREFFRSVGNDRRLTRQLYNYIKPPKQKPQKIFLLDDLKEAGKAKLKDIAAKTGYSPQNLCILYNGLEKDGLIAREVDSTDRRNTYYFLTDKGLQTLEKNKSKARDAIKELFGRLSDNDLTELKKSLEKVNNIIEKVMQRR